MRAILLLLFFAITSSTSANEVNREVEPGSRLEQELGYKLTIRDKHDIWRAEGLDKVFPINGPAPEYMIRFEATTVGDLEDLFGLLLTLKDGDGILAQIPLETRSKFSDDLARHRLQAHADGDKPGSRELDVKFLVKKELLEHAVVTIRCGTPVSEVSYTIRLADYRPKPARP